MRTKLKIILLLLIVTNVTIYTDSQLINPKDLSILPEHEIYNLESFEGFRSTKWLIFTDNEGRKFIRFMGYYDHKYFFNFNKSSNYYELERQVFKNYFTSTEWEIIHSEDNKVDQLELLREDFFDAYYDRKSSGKNSIWSSNRNNFDILSDDAKVLVKYYDTISSAKEHNYSYTIDYFEIEELLETNEDSEYAKYLEMIYNDEIDLFLSEFKLKVFDTYYLPDADSSIAFLIQDYRLSKNEKQYKKLPQYMVMGLKFNLISPSIFEFKREAYKPDFQFFY